MAKKKNSLSQAFAQAAKGVTKSVADNKSATKDQRAQAQRDYRRASNMARSPGRPDDTNYISNSHLRRNNPSQSSSSSNNAGATSTTRSRMNNDPRRADTRSQSRQNWQDSKGDIRDNRALGAVKAGVKGALNDTKTTMDLARNPNEDKYVRAKEYQKSRGIDVDKIVNEHEGQYGKLIRSEHDKRAWREKALEKDQKKSEEINKEFQDIKDRTKSKVGKFALDAVKTMSEMAVDAGTAAVTGTGPVGYFGSMSSRVIGQSYMDAKAKGATDDEAARFAFAEAGKEAGTEGMFAPAGKLGKSIFGGGYAGSAAGELSDKVANKLTGKVTPKALKDLVYGTTKTGFSALEEGIEEMVSEGLDPAVANALYQKNVTNRNQAQFRSELDKKVKSGEITKDQADAYYEQNKGKLDVTTQFNLGDVLYSGLLGGALGALGGGASAISQNAQGAQATNIYGPDGIKAMADSVVDVDESIAGASEQAKAIAQMIRNGETVANGQVAELTQAAQAQAQRNQNNFDDSMKAAQKIIKDNGHINPVSMRVEMTENGPAITPTLTENTMKVYGQNIETSREALTSVLNENGISMSDDQIQEVSEAIAEVQMGLALDPSTAENFTLSHPAERAALQNALGIELPDTNEGTRKMINTMMAENLVKTAQAEDQAVRDQMKGIVHQTEGGRYGRNGQMEFANAMRDVDIMSGTDVMGAAQTYEDYYRAGMSGSVTLDELNEYGNPVHSKVPERIRRAAYTAGIRDRQSAQNLLNGQIVEKGKSIAKDVQRASQSSTGASGTVTFAVDDASRKNIGFARSKMWQSVANSLGIDIVLADVENMKAMVKESDRNSINEGTNGFFNSKDNRIVINVDAQRGLDYTLMHELTHYIRMAAPEEYAKLAQLVVDRWSRSGDMMKHFEKLKQNEAYKNLTEEELLEEYIADATYEFLLDEGFVDEMTKTSPSLSQAVLDAIRYVLNRIRAMLAQGDMEGVAGQDLFSQLDILKEAEALWAAGYKKAQENALAVQKIGGRTAFSISPTLRNDLTNLVSNRPSSSSEIYVGESSQFLTDVINAKPFRVLMPPKKAYASMVSEGEAKAAGRYDKDLHYHNLGVDGLMRALEASEDPVIAIADVSDEMGKNRDDRIILITDQRHEGKVLTVIQNVDSHGMLDSKHIDTNKVITAYENEYIDGLIKDAVGSDRVLAIDKKRISGITSTPEGTSLSRRSSAYFENNIQNFWANVNYKHGKNTKLSTGDDTNTAMADALKNAGKLRKSQSPQLVEEVAASKGYTEHVYHGSPFGGFTTFKSENGVNWFTTSKDYAEEYQYKYDDMTDDASWETDTSESQMYEGYLNIDGKMLDLSDMDITYEYMTDEAAQDIASRIGVEANDILRIWGKSVGDGRSKYGLSVYEYTNDKGFANLLRQQGFIGIKANESGVDTYGMLDSNRFKTGEEITRDDQGNEIPLENRFDISNPDIRFSIDSMAQAMGTIYQKTPEGLTIFNDNDGKSIDEFTPEYVATTPIGRLLADSVRGGMVTDVEAQKQRQFLSDLFNMMLRTQDIDLIWAVNGTIGYNQLDPGERSDDSFDKKSKFAAFTSNADPQYSSTIDFTTICLKTQAVVDAMSSTMIRLGRGLTENEIIDIVFNEVYKAGEPVPCPVCYVFSRWVGLGGLFGKIKTMQQEYPEGMDTSKIKNRLAELENQVAKIQKERKKKGTQARDILHKELSQRMNQLDVIRQAVGLNEEQQKEYDSIEADLSIMDRWSWLKNTRLKDGWKPVPDEVLFDMNAARRFANEYPLTWKFRTTRGPSMGKAAAPYSPETLGQIIMGMASPGGIKNLGSKKNNFLGDSEKETKNAKQQLSKARSNAKRQNLMNGQRLQSTSDFRFEYGLDYLLGYMELQATGSKAQLYTKVPESVRLHAGVGAETNLSIMPLGTGLDENGNIVCSNVTGMDERDARALSKQYDNAQPIMVGIGRDHIIKCMESDWITMIIPYHSSGSSEARYKSMMDTVKESVESRTDYSKYESEHDVANMTREQKQNRAMRIKLLTGKAKTLTNEEVGILKNNERLRQLYIRFYGKNEEGEYERPDSKYVTNYDKNGHDADCYKVFLDKSRASLIMPYEYWDTNSTIENADDNGRAYQEYVKSLGYTPVFSGYSDGESYNPEYDFTDISGYWKTLIDRSMYNNDGTYHVQKPINVTNFDMDFLSKEESDKGIFMPSVVNDEKKTEQIVDRSVERIQAQMRLSQQRDSEGNELSPQQQEFFKDSKARDDNGRLLRLYHGAENAGFTVFAPEYSPSADEYGVPMTFLTDNKLVAKGYSGSYDSFDPYYMEKVKNVTSIEELRNLVPYYGFREEEGRVYAKGPWASYEADTLADLVSEMIDDEAIEEPSESSNYELYANVTNPLVVDANNNHWDEINAEFDGKTYASTNEIAAYAYQKGYDGVIVKNVYDTAIYAASDERFIAATDVIVFNSNQIKSVDNLNPTSNPDIRFSQTPDPTEEEVYDYMAAHPEIYEQMWTATETDSDYVQHRQATLEELRAQVKKLKQNQKKTYGKVLDEKSVRSDFNEMVKAMLQASSEGRGIKKTDNKLVNQAVENAKIMFKDFAEGNLESMTLTALNAAEDMVGGLRFINDDTYNYYKDLRDYLKTVPVRVDDTIKSDIPDYGEWRRAQWGRLRISKDGIPVDTMYEELCGMFPEMFDREISNPTDQLLRMGEAMEEVQPYAVFLSSEEHANLVGQIASDMIRITMLGKPFQSLADRYNDKVKAIQQRAREAERDKTRLQQELWKANERTKAEQIAAGREKAKLKRQGEEAIKNIKDKYKARDEARKNAIERAKKNKQLWADYTWLTSRLIKPNDQKHIPEEFRAALAGFLVDLDFQTENSKKLQEKYGGKIAQNTFKLWELRQQLQIIAAEDGTGPLEYDGYVFELMDAMLNKMKDTKDGGLTPIDELSDETLADVAVILRSIKHGIDNVDKARTEGIKKKISELGDSTIESCRNHINVHGKYKVRQNITAVPMQLLNESMVTPRDMFEQIGGGLEDVFMGIRHGFNKHVDNVEQARTFFADIFAPYENKGKPGSKVEEWRGTKSVQEFTLANGSKVSMSVAQIMSLYCSIKRAQAAGHIYGGGIVLTDVRDDNLKTMLLGKPKEIQTGTVKINPLDAQSICSKLTQEQKDMADALMGFLNNECAEWGNEASMAMYGYRKFTEMNYFPIKSSDQYLDSSFDSHDSVEKIKNFGFTKGTVVNANNPVVIDDIFSVVANHINQMSMYNAFAAPISDFTRVYNYRVEDEDGFKTISAKEAVSAAWGDGAQRYISNFIEDLQNQQKLRRDPMNTMVNKLLANYKKATIGFNLRVALQQPTAIVRSFAMISPKYFFTGDLNVKANLKDMKEHCQIAKWKSWGFNQIDLAGSMEDIMMNKEWSREDLLTMQIYGGLDDVTWSIIWDAVKHETKALHPEVEYESDEFYDLCNERASAIFDKTQVVDSPLHRSQIMRSKDQFVKMIVSFMAEPTRTFNMMRSAYAQAWTMWKSGDVKGARQIMAKYTSVYFLNALACGAAAAIADALRHAGDDDDKGYLRYVLQNWWSNFAPWNLLPLFKELESYWNGWGTSNMAFEGVESLMKSMSKIANGDYSAKAFGDLLNAIGLVTGKPIKNVRRELKAFFGVEVFASTTNILTGEEKSNEKDDGNGIVSTVLGLIGAGKNDSKGSGSESGSGEKSGEGSGGEGEDHNRAITMDDIDYGMYSYLYEDNSGGGIIGKAKSLFNIGDPGEDEKKADENHFNEAVEKVKAAGEGKYGEDYYNAIHSKATEGYSKMFEAGDIETVKEMRKVVEAAGGDVDKFDEKAIAAAKKALKKNLGETGNSTARWQLASYLRANGVSDQEISDYIAKSDTAKELQKALATDDQEKIRDYTIQLYEAGLTDESYTKLYDKRWTTVEAESTGTFAWPGSGRVSSGFGHRWGTLHAGMDIAMPIGSEVTASDGGEVIFVGRDGARGKYIDIRHDNGYVSRYQHLDWYDVQPGQKVAKGEHIAKSGNTGNSTGPHLHFAVYRSTSHQGCTHGTAVDPSKFLTGSM